jgi:KUP system potassium uptake protein
MHESAQHDKRYLLTLSLGALGVVYGDIGTSPLYAFRECFAEAHGLKPTAENILGILSLVFWSLISVVSIKYLVFVMRADNRGEGGILALMSLVRPRRSLRRGALLSFGLFGAALLYGEGMITPAITVLSAVEGLEIATHTFTPYIIPIAVCVLIGLFWLQKWGTARIGQMFGPIMLLWFTTLAVVGIWQIAHDPRVLAAVWPGYAVQFFLHNGWLGYLVLGSVVLVVTGGEALYADMGHFGAKPIRIAWFAFVLPSLLLNYFGQGAFLLHTPAGADDPFYRMVPQWSVIPMVVLATAASVIASQAMISGAFSLTRQAVQLGYLPRIRIRHTSEREIGQIYISSINWTLAAAAIGLVLAFRGSSNLAAAYGVAVTTTMTVTTLLFVSFAKEQWHWRIGRVALFVVPLLAIDLAFFGANILKVPDGGWFPLVAGVMIFTLMSTYRMGRRILAERLAANTIALDAFLMELEHARIPRVPGTAIFMSRNNEGIPPTLLHNIKHNKIVHQRVVLLTVEVEDRPRLEQEERYEWETLGHGVFRLSLHFGFMEDPDIPAALSGVMDGPLTFDTMSTSYFLGRETLIPTKQPGMAIWREHLFAWMMRNSSSASQFFGLPPNQVIELGAQVEL